MQTFETKLGKMETQLKQWGAKLDKLVTKAEDAGAEAKLDYRKRVNDLRAKHQKAQAKLEEARSAGSEKWDSFKEGVENAWNELETAFKKLTH